MGELLQMVVAVPILEVLDATEQGKWGRRDGFNRDGHLGRGDLKQAGPNRRVFRRLEERLEGKGKGRDADSTSGFR